MFRRYLWAIALLGLPRLVHANDLGPLSDLAPIGNALIAFMFLVGAVVVGWLGVGAFQSYRNRDLGGGMGEVMMNIGITVMAGIFIGVIIVQLIAPIRAMGATP
jgi:hypothetical protein